MFKTPQNLESTPRQRYVQQTYEKCVQGTRVTGQLPFPSLFQALWDVKGKNPIHSSNSTNDLPHYHATSFEYHYEGTSNTRVAGLQPHDVRMMIHPPHTRSSKCSPPPKKVIGLFVAATALSAPPPLACPSSLVIITDPTATASEIGKPLKRLYRRDNERTT